MVSQFQVSSGSVVIVSGFQCHDWQYLRSLMSFAMMQGNLEHWLIVSYHTKMVKCIPEHSLITDILPVDSNSTAKFKTVVTTNYYHEYL